MTIRDIIKDRQNEVRESKDLMPDRAAEVLVEITSLLGNCNDEIRKRDMEYNRVLLRCYESETKANRAKIQAESTEEYNLKREARDSKELCIELIRSLKFFLRAKEEEMRLSGRM